MFVKVYFNIIGQRPLVKWKFAIPITGAIMMPRINLTVSVDTFLHLISGDDKGVSMLLREALNLELGHPFLHMILLYYVWQLVDKLFRFLGLLIQIFAIRT